MANMIIAKVKEANQRFRIHLIVSLIMLCHTSCYSQKGSAKLSENTMTSSQLVSDRLNVQTFGEGERPLVLIHGLGSNAKAWAKIIPFLENDFKIYTVDLPKYLDRDNKSEVSISAYAGLVAEFILSLKSDNKVHLAGHSMGGQVAIKVALSHPDKLQSLILLAPAGLEQFSDSDKQWFKTWITKSYYVSLTDEALAKSFDINFYGAKLPEDARFMLDDRLALKKDSIRYDRYIEYVLKSISSMLDEPVHASLPEIKTKTLVLFGKDDMLIPNKILHQELTVQRVLDMADHIPNAQKQLIDDAGHFLQWDKPEDIAKHIKTFSNKNFTNE